MVGTLALDIATYADMAARGRPTSSVPAAVVAILARKAGLRALGRPQRHKDDRLRNRRSGLGALMGYAVGIGMGAAYGLLRSRARRIPWPLLGSLLGLCAMVCADAPAVYLKATDLRKWKTADWMSDLIPHCVYGIITAACYEAIERA